MPKSYFNSLLKKSKFNHRRISTIDWLSYHIDKNTGKPFLSHANQCAAEKFAVLCEKLIGQYRLSNWRNFIECGHRDEKTPCVGSSRRILTQALQTLGEDAQLTADIILRNYPLMEAERKYKLKRGKAREALRTSLDKLAQLFGFQTQEENI